MVGFVSTCTRVDQNNLLETAVYDVGVEWLRSCPSDAPRYAAKYPDGCYLERSAHIRKCDTFATFFQTHEIPVLKTVIARAEQDYLSSLGGVAGPPKDLFLSGLIDIEHQIMYSILPRQIDPRSAFFQNVGRHSGLHLDWNAEPEEVYRDRLSFRVLLHKGECEPTDGASNAANPFMTGSERDRFDEATRAFVWRFYERVFDRLIEQIKELCGGDVAISYDRSAT